MNTCEFLREANAIADQLRGKGAAMSAVRPGRGSSPALCSAGNSSRSEEHTSELQSQR